MGLNDLLVTLLPQLPLMAVITVGIVLAVVRWPRNPLASLLFVVGGATELALSLAYSALPMAIGDTGSMMAVFAVLRAARKIR